MNRRVDAFRLSSLFLLSVTLIAYELTVMRTFSVGSWSNFGSMVISIALLGYGLAGTLLTFLEKRVKAKPDLWLKVPAFLIAPAMALAHVLAQQIPFNPIQIVADAGQIGWIAAYYGLYAIPFFLGALFIGVSFMTMSERVHRLYFWNMAGSGVGGFIVLLFMMILPPDRLILPWILLSLVAGLLCAIDFGPEGKKPTMKTMDLVANLALGLASILLLAFTGQIRVSEFKSISYARNFPDARLVYHTWSPLGEMHVYDSQLFHFAPGLSDNASLSLERMPEQAFLGLYIDGGGPIGIMRQLRPDEERYIDFLPMTAPYLLKNDPDVLLLGLGGGAGVFTALHHGAERVDIAENNPDLVRVMRDDPGIADFNGHILSDPRVAVHVDEPRAYCASTDSRFDVIELSLIDGVGLSQTGGYPVVENYTYTAEGMRDYMSCLESDGILSLTVWNRLTPPRNVPRLMATVAESLRLQGVEDPGSRVYAFHLLLSTATILVKNSPFTEDEVAVLDDFCRRMSFEPVYTPFEAQRSVDFEAMLDEYTAQYAELRDPNAAPAMSLLPGDFYHFAMHWLLDGRQEELYRRYVFDIRPATDSRPYYTAYLKPGQLGIFMDQLGEVSEEWGYIMLLGTLVLSIAFAVLIILIPVAGRWKELFAKKKGTLGVIVYFSCLGLGYMLVEIFLIQRFVFFLSDPVYSTSIVITTMLIVSGLGSLMAGRIKNKRRLVLIAAGGVALMMVLYLTLLNPVLSGLLGAALVPKMLLSVLFIAPAAFCLGMFFPSGLSRLGENRPGLLPWAWGMNGALSVTGSVTARLVSVSYGFPLVLAAVVVLYAVAALTFRANEAK